MADWFELGLFLYAFLGSASIGYWALVLFSPDIRTKPTSFKTGLSVGIGALYVLIVFVLAIWLSTVRFNGWSFLEAFFWILPLSVVFFSLAGMLRQGIVWAATTSHPTTVLSQPKPPASTEDVLAQIENEKIAELPQATVTPTPMQTPLFETHEVEKELQAGESEKDVAEEIKKIMAAGRMEPKPPSEPEPAPVSTSERSYPKAPSSDAIVIPKPALTADEIEKIKRELKQKIDQAKKQS